MAIERVNFGEIGGGQLREIGGVSLGEILQARASSLGENSPAESAFLSGHPGDGLKIVFNTSIKRGNSFEVFVS